MGRHRGPFAHTLPAGPSAAEFLGRWEAAGHYGCFLRMCKEAFTGLLWEGRLGGRGGGGRGLAAAMKGWDTPSLQPAPGNGRADTLAPLPLRCLGWLCGRRSPPA